MSRKSTHSVLALPDLSAISALASLASLPGLLPALLAASAMLAAPALGQGPGREGGPPARPGAAEAFAKRLMASDANKDGKLTIDEMDPFSGQTIMDRADTNGDGMLTPEELMQMVKDRIAGRPLRGMPGYVPREGAGDDAAGQGKDGMGAGMGAGMGGSYHDAMERAGRAMRLLKRSPMDASSRETDLGAVQMMQMGLLVAKSRAQTVKMSDNARKVYGSDAKKQHQAMRLAIINAVIESLKLEAALTQGNTDEAKEIYGQIRDMRDEAHDIFQAEDHDDHDSKGNDGGPGKPDMSDMPRKPRKPGKPGKQGGGGSHDEHNHGGGG